MATAMVKGNETVKDNTATVKATETVKKADSVQITGKVFATLRNDFMTGNDKAVAIIAIKHPFDETEEDIELTIWDRGRKGRFDYLARKAISELPDGEKQELKITGELKLLNIVNKLRRTSYPCVNIELNDLFTDGKLFVKCSSKEVNAVLVMEAEKNLNITENRAAKSN